MDEQGAAGVWLVSGTYKVEYQSTAGGALGLASHDVEVTDAHTQDNPLDLVVAAPPGGQVLAASQFAALSARIDALGTGGGEGGATTWSGITDKPSTFPPSTHTHTATQVSDSTSTGRSLLTAASAAAARTTIGAGTSNLVLGSSSSQAAAGDHLHDSRYIRTVNGAAPDSGGNVTVASDGSSAAVTALELRTVGYADLGTVSGAVSINGQGTAAATLSGATAVTLTGVNGDSVLLDIDFAGHALTVNGDPVTVTPSVWVRSRGRWVTGATTGEPVETPDTTLPTAGTLSVAAAQTTADLSVSGALDDVALHATPYSFSKDGGTTWTAWKAAGTHQFTGLTPATEYVFTHRVRDAAGNIRQGTPVTRSTTTASALTEIGRSTFTAADGTTVAGLAWDTGGLSWSGSSSPTVQSNKAAFLGESQVQASAPERDVQRVTIDYDFTGNTRNGEARVAVRSSGWPCWLRVMWDDGAKKAHLQILSQVNWQATWVGTYQGLPVTGTVGVLLDAKSATGEAYVNGVKVADLASTEVGANRKAMGPLFDSQFVRVDNVILESSAT